MLQQIGLYKNIIPESITPNDLDSILESSQTSNVLTSGQSE